MISLQCFLSSELSFYYIILPVAEEIIYFSASWIFYLFSSTVRDLEMIEGIYSRAFPISQVQIKASTCAATCLYKSGRLQTQLVNEFHRWKGSRQISHFTALSKLLHKPQPLPEWGPVGAVSLLLWVCLSLCKVAKITHLNCNRDE